MPKKPEYLKASSRGRNTAVESEDLLSELKPLANEFADLRQDKERLEAELTQIATRMSQISDTLCEKFEKIGLSSAKMEGLGIFYVSNIGRPKVEDEGQLFSDLRKRGLGDLIKETVHSQTLQAALKEARTNGEPDFAGITVYEQTAIRMRKA